MIHLVVPMSGMGKRFVAAGYKKPKPIIEVDKRPIIAHIIDMYENYVDKYTFIINEYHDSETDIRFILSSLCPAANIISIKPHKDGPVGAIRTAYHIIDDEDKIIINYCDFAVGWDIDGFIKLISNPKIDACIPAYKGFHPHMIGSTNYAFMRWDKELNLLEIKEKEPFTTNREDEYASSGTYYFAKGALMKQYFDELLVLDERVNGEFYVSMVNNLLINDGKKVKVFEIEYMLQWGIPEDLEDYQLWSNFFHEGLSSRLSLNNLELENSVTLISMAGEGSRFKKEGYKTPKPFILVNGLPMYRQALKSLPNAKEIIYVIKKDHEDLLMNSRRCSNSEKIVTLEKTTEGQAISCSIGLETVKDRSKKLFVMPSDSYCFIKDENQKMLQSKDWDILVFSSRSHRMSQVYPKMFGWVATDDYSNVIDCGVKSNPDELKGKIKLVISGFFGFKSIELFDKLLQEMLKDSRKINSEYYVDTMIVIGLELGLKIKIIPVEKLVSWGTPNELKTFNYWKGYFKKYQNIISPLS